MKWIENSSDRNAEADRWGLWESLASLQNVAIQTTQKPPTWFFGRWRFLEEWRGNWTSQHPKNCINVTWVMKRPNGLWEGFSHLRRRLCRESNSALDILPRNVCLGVKSFSIKPTLIYSRELENEPELTFGYISILFMCKPSHNFWK